MRRAHLGLLVALGLAGGAAASLATGCDEVIEAVLCSELAPKVCNKWFSCWPVVSTATWGDQGTCSSVVRSQCANTEALYGCDIDNADLRDCNSSVSGSSCGSMPASCQALLACTG